MSLLKRFLDNIKQQQLFSEKDKLLLAVSGGIDSVVLCELCKQAGFDFVIAHCNFQLRGEESDRDEKFVQGLGKKYGVEVLVNSFGTEKYAGEKKLSIQEAARDLRYSWFEQLVGSRESGVGSQESGVKTPKYLLTAHHADDNAETVLMSFCRGTGLQGLTGIPVMAGHIRRPLLSFSKNELQEFAGERQLDFVEDSSNRSSKYTRNRFRNEIIPVISKVYPQVKDNLHATIMRFKEIKNLYQFAVGELKKKLCRKKGKEIYIPIKQLLAFNNKALIYEIISDQGFSEKQVDEVLKLAVSESGHYIENANHRIIKHRHWFIIAPKKDLSASNIIIEEEDKNLQLTIGDFQITRLPIADFKMSTANSVACLDAKDIRFPMLLRKWKTGDYFYPLGMKKKKKLSRFFIDQKISRTDKENVWVLEMNQKIIWVVGYRMDDRFKITGNTEVVLQLTIKRDKVL